MNTAPFKKVAELEAQKKALEIELDVARTEAATEMTTAAVDKVESEFGSFFFTIRKKWTYTDAVKVNEEKIKELKKYEEDNSVATFEETKSLNFRAKKLSTSTI